MKDRNILLCISRFIAAISIAIYHFEWIYIHNPVFFGNFYIWVEFFFILSGFFVGIKLMGLGDKLDILGGVFEGRRYVIKQIKKQYPLYLIAFLFNFICIQITRKTYDVYKITSELWDSVWEVLLMTPFTIREHYIYNIGGAPMQVPITIYAAFLVFVFYSASTKVFKLIAPLVSWAGIILILISFGNMSQWNSRLLFIKSGIIRGVAEVMLGAWVATCFLPFCEKLKANAIYLIAILGCVIGILSMVIFRDSIHDVSLVGYIPVFCLLILSEYIIGMRSCYCKYESVFKIIYLLEKITYPIFLFHAGVLQLFDFFLPHKGYIMVIPFIVLVLVLSIMVICLGVNKQGITNR